MANKNSNYTIKAYVNKQKLGDDEPPLQEKIASTRNEYTQDIKMQVKKLKQNNENIYLFYFIR